MMAGRLAAPLAALLILIVSGCAFAQWQAPQLLNGTGETDAKAARIAASQYGGFHAVYNNANPSRVQYRRYIDGYLGPIKILDNHAVPQAVDDICEAGNGDVHVVFEDWEEWNKCGWAISRDGGQTFTYTRLWTGQGCKYPVVAPFGPSNGPDVIVSFGKMWPGESAELFWARYDGTSWSSIQHLAWPSNEYQLEGICRSLQDGTVYRSYGVNIGGTDTVCYRRYNGSYWEPQVVVASPGFFARQSIAVNPSGQIMAVYERDEYVRSKLYTPGVGWSGEMLQEYHSISAQITAIPGSNDFYMVYAANNGQIYGRRYIAGSGWAPKESISSGLPGAMMVGPDVCAGPDGTLYAAFEYWGTGKPQQYYNVYPGVVGPMGTVSGVVRDQYGLGVSGAAVGSGTYAAVSGAGGAYSLQLPAGTRTISANKDYYTGQTISSIAVAAGQTTWQDFTIAANPPAQVSSFTVNASDGLNRLYWTNPASGNFHATTIRFRTTGYPAGPADGTLLCDRPTSPGQQDSLIHGGLTNDVSYYYAAFSRDADGHYAVPIYRVATPHSLKLSECKQLVDGYLVELKNKAVTAVFSADACIYVKDPDRTCGMRIATSASVAVGDRVDIAGTLATRTVSSQPCERVVAASSVTKVGEGAVAPVSIRCCSVGGAGTGLVLGVKDGVGVNTMGMLVTIVGKVTDKMTSYVHVDDGSGVIDFNGASGVLVRCPDSTQVPNVGDVVRVTGVIEGSVPSGWTANRRYVRMRDWNDKTVYYVPPPPAGWIAGTVKDTGGVGIGGATVATTSGGYSTTTAADGSYTIGGVLVGTYNVTASKSGYSTQTIYTQAVTKDQTTTVNFTLTASPGSISGTVKDPSGNALSGAIVSTNTGGYSTTSAGNGTYTLSGIAPGTYNVTASKAGYGNQTQNGIVVNPNQTTTLNFTLSPLPGAIQGYVRDGSGMLLSGATVTASPGGYSATSDSGGLYRLSSVPAGTYSVTASKTGYGPQTKTNITVPPGSTASCDFSLTAQPGTITGFVKDTSNNALSGATVSTNTGGYSTTSGGDGGYTLSNVAPNTYSVTASKTGYSSQTNAGVVVPAGGSVASSFNLAYVGTQKLTNGNFEGGYFNSGWWGGYCATGWGFAWKGAPGQNWFYQNSFSYGGPYGTVHLVQNKHDNYEVGIGQEIAGLTPGATYTLSAESYKPSGCNHTVYLAVRDGTGYGSEMGTTAGTAFAATTGAWVSQTVTGAVPASGGISVYVWVKRPSGSTQYDVYFDNVSLLSW